MACSDNKKSFEEFLSQLPKERFWDTIDIYQWEGHWFQGQILEVTLSLRTKFDARRDDVILTSFVKTGTTWLKALSACIMHGGGGGEEAEDILTKGSPHVHVPTIESMVFAKDSYSIISCMPSPRLVHSHLPWNLLPDSIKNSECKIVYIARNPKDTFISWWLFHNGLFQHVPMEDSFEVFLQGKFLHGPFFDHVLEYWKASLEMPDRVLFLKYEDMKRDPKGQVKRLALFLGKNDIDETKLDDVLWKCSIERLKSLDVNKNGTVPWNGVPTAAFFRKGVAGDSKNYLTPEMEERINEASRVKFEGSFLEFD